MKWNYWVNNLHDGWWIGGRADLKRPKVFSFYLVQSNPTIYLHNKATPMTRHRWTRKSSPGVYSWKLNAYRRVLNFNRKKKYFVPESGAARCFVKHLLSQGSLSNCYPSFFSLPNSTCYIFCTKVFFLPFEWIFAFEVSSHCQFKSHKVTPFPPSASSLSSTWLTFIVTF